ncbi:Homeobox protein tos8 [Marasmius tenuissimus]|nr:Homeobox protein tos8 [Marasmius tenuissimus]
MKDGSHPIAAGGFADIWRGRLEDDQSVCLKVLRIYTGNFDKNKIIRDLGNEVLIWRQLRHPNVHEFLGVTSELFKPSYCIVSPWMANGDVMSYCRQRNSSLDVKVAMMQESCEGLRYLHEYNPPIVHSDIKSMNILVSDDGHCRISDFGLSTIENDSPEGRVSDSTSRAAMRGSIPWLAPELMNPGGVESPNRTTRDIYALGCTMYELLAGSPPFSDRKMDPQIMIAVLSGLRPTRPAGCPDQLWTIIENCWTEDSGSRPVASQVTSLLVKVTFPTPESDTQHTQTCLSDHNDLYLPNVQQEDDSSHTVESSQQQQPNQSPQTPFSDHQTPFNLRLSIPLTSYSDTPRSHAFLRAPPTQTTSFGQTLSPSPTLYSLPPMTNDDESQNPSHVTQPLSPRAIDAHLQPPSSKGMRKVNQKGKTFITRGACLRCKGLKNLYRYKTNTDRCVRCANGGHECTLSGRKNRGAEARLERQRLLAKIQKQAETIEKLKSLLANAANILNSPVSDDLPSPPSPFPSVVTDLEAASVASYELPSLPESRADSPVSDDLYSLRSRIPCSLSLARSDYSSSSSSVASVEEDAEVGSDVDEGNMDDLETESMAVETGSMEDLVAETDSRSSGLDYNTPPTLNELTYGPAFVHMSEESPNYPLPISIDLDFSLAALTPLELVSVVFSPMSPMSPSLCRSVSDVPSPPSSLSSVLSVISIDDDEGGMDYTPDPIWDDISVQDAWKGFRLRVGTSELTGVPSALEILTPIID